MLNLTRYKLSDSVYSPACGFVTRMVKYSRGAYVKFNDIKEFLKPTANTGSTCAPQMPPTCAECYKITGYICRYKYNSIYCQAKLWRHFVHA